MGKLMRDGVSLAYEDAGSGDPPLLLLHGIACDRSHLRPQIEHFSRRHRVVAMDLRGHGDSDAPDGVYGVEPVAGDVAWLSQELALERPVVIGHSLGGVVALAVAARFPEVPSAIVALDSPLIPSAQRQAHMPDFIESLRTDAYEENVVRYFSALFLETDDPQRKRGILDGILQVPPHVVISVWEEWALNFDTEAAARACQIPFLYLDAGTPNTDLGRLAELCPALRIGRTVGAGHFHQLEVPDQVNAMVERFLLTAPLR